MIELRSPTISAALSFALKAYGNNPLLLIGASIAVWACTTAGFLIAGAFLVHDFFSIVMTTKAALPGLIIQEVFTAFSLQTVLFAGIAYLFFHLLGAVLYLGAIRITFDIVDTGSSTFRRIFSEYTKLPSYVIASALYALSVTAAALLLVLPALFLITLWYFYPQAVVTEHASPIESLRRSAQITKGNRLKTFALIITLMVITSLGYSIALVGPILISPFAWLASAYYYRALANSTVV
jgi:hypothetical protein